MADVRVRFQCNCVAMVDVDKTTSPRCETHGSRAAGVVKAPAPRFTGCVRGPVAVTRALPAIDVSHLMRPAAEPTGEA